MNINDVRDLHKYTNDLEVLNLMLNKSREYLNYVISLYERFRSFNIAQEAQDILAKAYIKLRLLNDKITIEKLLYSDTFLSKVNSMTIDEVKQYAIYCEDERISMHLCEDYAIKGSTKLHLELIKDEIKHLNQMDQLKSFLQELNMSPNEIKRITNSFSKLATDSSDELLKILLTKELYKGTSTFEISMLIEYFKSINDPEHLKIILNLLKCSFKKDDYNLVEVINIASIINQSDIALNYILTKEVLEKYSLKEIKDLVRTIIEKPFLRNVINTDTIKELTWKQFKELINLIQKEEINEVSKEIANLLNNHGEFNFYERLKSYLLKQEYQKNVEEYLKECSTIADFITTIESKVKEDTEFMRETKI